MFQVKYIDKILFFYEQYFRYIRFMEDIVERDNLTIAFYYVSVTVTVIKYISELWLITGHLLG